MKNKKYFAILPLLLSMSLFLFGCGDSIKETITEKTIEKITDGEVDIDTKDGKVSFGNEDGSVTAGENLEWPKESMGSLPEPDGGSDYMEELLDNGYVQSSFTKMDTMYMYMFAKEDNTSVMLNFDSIEGGGSITFVRNDESSQQFFEDQKNDSSDEEVVEVNMDESMDWPKDAMDNIPEIKAQITSVTQDANQVTAGFKGLSESDMVAYIEEIKSLGFDVSVTEMVMNDLLAYTATNKNEQMISINWSANEGSITYTK